MPAGDKSKYTDKQKRKAGHIAEGYEERGMSEGEAERRAWATVNKDDGGGKKSGSGRGTETGHPAAHEGGEKGGKISASRPAAAKSASAKKACRYPQATCTRSGPTLKTTIAVFVAGLTKENE